MQVRVLSALPFLEEKHTEMKKILIKNNPWGDVTDLKAVCDCTGMKTYDDARAYITHLYRDVYTDERIREIAAALAKDGEYWENGELSFKVLDISNLKNPLAEG